MAPRSAPEGQEENEGSDRRGSERQEVERRDPVETKLGPRHAARLLRVGRGKSVVAPHARRLNERMRGMPAVARTQDRIREVWDRLVEALCQAIEPLLERRFPDLRLVAVADGGGALDLHRVGRDGARSLGRLDGMAPEAKAGLAATRWSAVELRLPASQILERKLSLPAASRDFLAPILEHRLDRLTPWRPDKVLYGYRACGDGAVVGSVAVTVTATSRDLVAAPLDRLRAVGLAATAIGADAGPPKTPLAVNLLGGGAATAPRAESRRFVSNVMAVVLGAALIVWIGTALVATGAARDQDAATLTLAKARRLLRGASFGNLGSREQAMLEAKQPDRSMVVLIDRLSTSIPADTYLKNLTIQPDKVLLVGSSGNAPALIGKLEAAGLANVRFTSTIARDKAGRDDFELSADRPQAKPEDAP